LAIDPRTSSTDHLAESSGLKFQWKADARLPSVGWIGEDFTLIQGATQTGFPACLISRLSRRTKSRRESPAHGYGEFAARTKGPTGFAISSADRTIENIEPAGAKMSSK
jgi:hypothetical protein